jgi:hypothetical protein
MKNLLAIAALTALLSACGPTTDSDDPGMNADSVAPYPGEPIRNMPADTMSGAPPMPDNTVPRPETAPRQ